MLSYCVHRLAVVRGVERGLTSLVHSHLESKTPRCQLPLRKVSIGKGLGWLSSRNMPYPQGIVPDLQTGQMASPEVGILNKSLGLSLHT